jgi:hypothetical protein
MGRVPPWRKPPEDTLEDIRGGHPWRTPSEDTSEDPLGVLRGCPPWVSYGGVPRGCPPGVSPGGVPRGCPPGVSSKEDTLPILFIY